MIVLFVIYIISVHFAWLMTKLGHQIVFKHVSPTLNDAIIVFLPLLNIYVGLFYLVEIIKLKFKAELKTSKYFFGQRKK
ncbi:MULTISPECIES: hypothetical protein [Bacillus]|uniref:hypothetical protein n=1 Tax=Bacillus TaxID=1386 RepID=UPI000550D1A4|nr:hypothetical protein [Bacillus licheniformis]AKQ71756.1 hypothetical protein MUY_000624 [Bacillus licheniformis WX-02]MCP8974430.1 hypothetical protein [Bacillus licheniformis]